jgi:hypothetical protein
MDEKRVATVGAGLTVAEISRTTAEAKKIKERENKGDLTDKKVVMETGRGIKNAPTNLAERRRVF